MVLIADSGSTKAGWCLLNGDKAERIKTQGLSPFFLSSAQIATILQNELLPGLPQACLVRKIRFYGTGCSIPKNVAIVKEALASVFPDAQDIHVEHDLMAAAHSLCGNKEGIACILGTGSNSCYFNGLSIERNSPGLGYILGDEGSGAYLGKKLLQSYLYGRFDTALKARFEEQFGVTETEVLEKVYKHPLANRYMASFTVFLSANRQHPTIDAILYSGLEDFFSEHITTYKQSKEVPVHFTGSIAWVFSDVIKSLCNKYGLILGTIEKEPMDGLIRYYQDHQDNTYLVTL